jgi:N-acetylmuramoyl-L-alanine amidase
MANRTRNRSQKNLPRVSVRMVLRLQTLFALASFGVLASCSSPGTANVRNTSRSFTTVVVDAGHGGRDCGASRRYGPPEKVVTLDVAQRLDRKLRESQFRTVMTRSSDVFVPLDERVAIGNREKNSVFVSVHFNDSSRRAIRGFETYYSSPYARSLAERIQRKLLMMKGASNRGVRMARYRVLRNAAYPSVLVECGFLSNRGDGRLAASSSYREILADKISEAIVEERYGAGVYDAPPRPPEVSPSPDVIASPPPVGTR